MKLKTKQSGVSGKAKAEHPSTRTIGIVGLGYVGLPLAIVAEAAGHRILGFDIDSEKIQNLKERKADFLSEREMRSFERSAMEIGMDPQLLGQADVFIVCVPTPVHEDHTPDLEPLKDAARTIAPHIRKDTLVIIESTVNPGACEEVVLPILEDISGLKAEKDFLFAHCPERINPGDARWDVGSIPRVLGGSGPRGLEEALFLYRSILEADITPMNSIKEAEAVKMVENSFRDINIAFVNELAMAFAKTNIDILNVIRGARTKPFGFMPHYPGCGVGGHCIPVDPYYLIRYGEENGFTHRFLMTAREVNNGMPLYTIELLQGLLKKNHRVLKGSTIALLGMSYKRDVPDMRESPALVIQKELLRQGAIVRTFDPLLPTHSNTKNTESALAGAAGAIIATDHAAFRALPPEIFLRQGVSVVVDGRNCLSKDDFLAAGILYKGIGR